MIYEFDIENVLKSDCYEKEFFCDNSEHFCDTIMQTLQGNENLIDEYIRNKNGKINDVCVGHLIGTGETTIVNLIKAVVLSGKVSIIDKFLKKYPEFINYSDNEYSLLTYSIVNNKIDISNYLIDNKINVNIRERRGKTALYYAINSQNYDLVSKLLLNKADPNLEYALPRLNMFSHSLIDRYSNQTNNINYKKICILLLKHGVNIQTEKFCPKQIKLLEELQAEIEFSNK